MRWTRAIGLLAATTAAIPTAGPASVVTPAIELAVSSRPRISNGERYVVRVGDTLAGIAARSGVRVADIAAQNGITNPNLIREGAVLQIPRGPAPPTPPSPARNAANPTLRLGDTGPAVADLQRRLGHAGTKVATDGTFGPKTTAAVISFQKHKGLQTDAIVGSRTWSALGASTPSADPTTPSPPSDGGWKAYGSRSYTTKSGDTWTTLGKATSIGASALATANRRKPSDMLAPGTVLAVPGPWRCPVSNGVFINDWGFTRSGGRTHQGNDLFAPRGRPVLAPVGGKAERHPNGLGGIAVQLHGDDGNRYYFAHLDSYGKTGPVVAGAVLGTVGNSGAAITTVTHLHLEIHPGGGPAINPFPTLTLACKRS